MDDNCILLLVNLITGQAGSIGIGSRPLKNLRMPGSYLLVENKSLVDWWWNKGLIIVLIIKGDDLFGNKLNTPRNFDYLFSHNYK